MKLPTVTIGIPAHNEARNIGALISSILHQNSKNYNLVEIFVHSDNCSDDTVKIVNEISKKNSIVTQLVSKKRSGKSVGVNRLRKKAKGDIYISLDADIILGNKNTISEMVKVFSDKDVCLVGANDIPLSGRNLTQKLVAWRITYWLNICRNLNGGDTVHNHPGRANACRRSFYKKFTLPGDVLADDDYQYFSNKKIGNKFSFAKKSIVYYKTPNSLKDFLKQFSRFQSTENSIRSEFGELAIEGYKISYLNKINGLMKTFFQNPIFTILVLIMQLTLVIYNKQVRQKAGEKWWDTVKSTK